MAYQAILRAYMGFSGGGWPRAWGASLPSTRQGGSRAITSCGGMLCTHTTDISQRPCPGGSGEQGGPAPFLFLWELCFLWRHLKQCNRSLSRRGSSPFLPCKPSFFPAKKLARVVCHNMCHGSPPPPREAHALSKRTSCLAMADKVHGALLELLMCS